MKPSSPRRASSARSAATRGALAPRSPRSSNDWKCASNMGGNLGAAAAAGNGAARPGAAHEHQRRPAVEVDAPFERQRAIGGERGVRLRRQQAREDDAARRARSSRRSGAARRCSGPSRMLAKTRSNGARARRCARATPSALTTSTIAPARLSRALARATRTALGSMSVASTRCRSARAAAMASTPLPVPRSRMHCARSPGVARRVRASAARFAEPVERQQAAARGAVMAGAEGERRLDLDADAVGRNAGAVMGAVHDEAAGRDRLQPGEALAHPVLRRDRARNAAPWPPPRPRRPRRPARAPPSRRARRGNGSPRASARRPHPQGSPRLLGGETLGDESRDPARGLFIRFEPGDRRGRAAHRTAGNH